VPSADQTRGHRPTNQRAEIRLYEGDHAFFAQDRRTLPDVLAFLDSSP